MGKNVYIETSVVSYYTGRPSRDLIVAARQQVTREWWDGSLPHYSGFVSVLVLDEASRGDRIEAEKRLAAVSGMKVLQLTDDAIDLARSLVEKGPLPAEHVEDALHISIATVNGMDFLVTWNCKHIANAEMRKSVVAVVGGFGYECPVICTPDELVGGS